MANRLPVLFVLLLLSGLLLAAAGAQGASAGPAATTSAFEEEFEGLEDELEEEGEEDEYTCEEAEVEFELGEIDEVEAAEACREAAESRRAKHPGRTSAAPEECVLRSVKAHATLNAPGDKLKLTIGYTAYEPVGAKVEVRKGSSRIAARSLQLSRSGVLRIVKDLGKAEAPKRVLIRLVVPDSPGFCGKYETEKVPVH